MSSTRSLTLIVAATENMGIGTRGGLPWPSIRQEMAYFTRVTKRVPEGCPAGARNLVIMGRKTWDSIPEKYRPLKERINIVVSGSKLELIGGAILTSRLSDAVEIAQENRSRPVGRAFVIGGSSLYSAALALEEARNILLTKVKANFTCDTFFPFDLDSQEAKSMGWQRKSRAELESFIGERLDSETCTEGEIEFEFCLYQKHGKMDMELGFS